MATTHTQNQDERNLLEITEWGENIAQASKPGKPASDRPTGNRALEGTRRFAIM
jgi:hypothetical protein